uniref:p01990-3R n=1 Tax=African swine fever virus TaxID=10497 RepID=A0A6G7KT55_ASF
MNICVVWCFIYMLLAFLLFALQCYIISILCVFFIHLTGRRTTLYILLCGLPILLLANQLSIQFNGSHLRFLL